MNEPVITDPGAGLAVGRKVHYVLAERDLPIARSLGGNMSEAQAGDLYPGDIVRVWRDVGNVNLVVQVDGPKALHVTSVQFSRPADELETLAQGQTPSYEPGTWHWPPRVG